ncbi:PGG domain-containing protein [Artemisia annua]|uniref:PGG domain-containing protein n=1 Tax=Artemisia annua TaxID=35608 RepID=A0A2U1Q6B2_ARTAN|nr:PGG domain-containing protein [Artemisia annua]
MVSYRFSLPSLVNLNRVDLVVYGVGIWVMGILIAIRSHGVMNAFRSIKFAAGSQKASKPESTKASPKQSYRWLAAGVTMLATDLKLQPELPTSSQSYNAKQPRISTRYADEDFLYKLPKRLIYGLVMLFVSVTSMMIAFSAALYIMFGQGKAWILIPIAALACLPIASFVKLQ